MKVLICIGCNVIGAGKENSDEESGDESYSKNIFIALRRV
jgi:hypothetical protein